tara:strand:- start:457 stop:708 length:252 start_codon:yes stop_codon:yes gene_type:complete
MQVKRREGISKNLTRRHNRGLLLYSANKREAVFIDFEILPAFVPPCSARFPTTRIDFGIVSSECDNRTYIAIIDSIIFADAWK